MFVKHDIFSVVIFQQYETAMDLFWQVIRMTKKGFGIALIRIRTSRSLAQTIFGWTRPLSAERFSISKVGNGLRFVILIRTQVFGIPKTWKSRSHDGKKPIRGRGKLF